MNKRGVAAIVVLGIIALSAIVGGLFTKVGREVAGNVVAQVKPVV